ncbi:MAG: phosphoribosylanthranilate isomerase [Gammaproteobacteria bacterium]|nr:phosphoribosylanthranilate isomerase [Gammaproteobacteria bacterium]
MNNRTRVKICGITREQDARHAAARGADSIGLVFHRPSSRVVDLDQAIAIRRILPPFVTVTALFLDETEDWIAQVVHALRPDCLQFHGRESVQICESWRIPYIKAIPMGDTQNPAEYASQYASAQGFLMDSNVAGRLGGSGDTFDWSRIPATLDFPLLLAGGVNASNVAEAITRVRPWGVDVSTGVESAKGIKDAGLMDQFFREVRRGDGYHEIDDDV